MIQNYLEVLADRYYQRWRDTDRVQESKMTLWISATTAIVASVALGDDLAEHDRALLWVLGAAISLGIGLRLMRAKHSINRSVRVLNEIRRLRADQLTSGDSSDKEAAQLLSRLFAVDVTPPPLFSLFSTVSAAGVASGACLVLAAHEAWPDASLVVIDSLAGVGYLTFMAHYWKRAKRVDRSLKRQGL